MERGENECKRETRMKEVKSEGTITGITEESQRVCFVEEKVFLKGELKYERRRKCPESRREGARELGANFKI